MKIDIIAGVRPNFIKIAPIIHELNRNISEGVEVNFRLIHTGQHFDKQMSQSFFEQLSIPLPDINLMAGGGTQAEQTASIMIGYERVLFDSKPDLCIVVGDVTSTMACSIVAKKMNIKVAHVEAGIRSKDLSMPEEINRLLTDSITDYFFTTSEFANQNLIETGVPKNKIFFVGNTMIDTLLKEKNNFCKPIIYDQFDLKKSSYFVLTLHRPSNVDIEDKLIQLLNEIVTSARDLPIIFPVHPRTSKILVNLGFEFSNLHYVEPLSYLEFNFLVQNSKAVITDSGGITEETTVLGIPCLTIRDNTERPETVFFGTNELIGTDIRNIRPAFDKVLRGNWKSGSVPELWDGMTSKRIVSIILNEIPNDFI